MREIWVADGDAQVVVRIVPSEPKKHSLPKSSSAGQAMIGDFHKHPEIKVPDNELHMRVVTLQEALDDVGRNPRTFVIINSERHPSGVPMPNQPLLERLRGDCAGELSIIPTTLAELDVRLPLCRDREHFIAGRFVVLTAMKVHTIPERGVGGQDVEGLEKRARDGLYVTVAMATERLRACADFSEHRKMATEARRGEIFERLQPLLGDVSARNCFAEGQKRIEDWYPGPTAYRTMKSAYMSVQDGLRGGADRVSVDAELIDLVRTAGMVYAKANAFLEAQHAASGMTRELMESDEFKNAAAAEQYDMQARLLREQAPALHQEMTHNKRGGPSLAQLTAAAASMDVNPSWVFTNVLFYKRELDCAMLLGRVERGVGAMLGPQHIVRLKRFMAQADESEDKDAVVDTESEAARFLRDLALRVKSRAGWDEFFAIAEPEGREFWISKAL